MKAVLALAIVAICLASAFAACPNACSGHGTCSVGNTCVCTGLWAGSDCSYQIVPLTANTPVDSSVGFRNWAYYKFTSVKGAAFHVLLDQTSDGDADIYVRKSQLPTTVPGTYDYKDISLDEHVDIEVPATTPAVNVDWFIGVFGFQQTAYTIKIRALSSSCPPRLNDCNGHGQCVNNQCVCTAGFAGDDCSTAVQEVVLNTPLSGITITRAQWKYYHFHLGAGQASAISIVTTQVSTNGDVDTFVKVGNVPSFDDWDYADAGLEPITSLNISNPAAGEYFVGLYGFVDTTFNLVVSTSSGSCPNQCSRHGDCIAGRCRCNTGFEGEACQTLSRAVRDLESFSGYVEGNAWNYYRYVSNSGNNFLVEVDHEEGLDCDIYVLSGGEKPTRFHFNYRDVSPAAHATVRVENPGRETWWIGVFGFTECAYNLRIRESNQCPGNCNGHGTCSPQGHCICNPGFAGENCEVTSSDLSSGTSTTGVAKNNKWTIYKFIATSSAVNVILSEASTAGQVWLFVGVGMAPTLTTFDFADVALNTATHRVSMTWDTAVRREYYIGVYGSPYLEHDLSFNLVAWASPF